MSHWGFWRGGWFYAAWKRAQEKRRRAAFCLALYASAVELTRGEGI